MFVSQAWSSHRAGFNAGSFPAEIFWHSKQKALSKCFLSYIEYSGKVICISRYMNMYKSNLKHFMSKSLDTVCDSI